MDGGMAALIAAGVGLLGAVLGAAIGGLAAVRGARVGAETTARATAQQVRDQAEVGHQQWLRQQRLEATHGLYSAYDQYVDAVTAMKALLDGDVRAAERVQNQQIGPAVDAVERGYSRVKLLGPEQASVAARRLRDAVRTHADAVIEWRQQVVSYRAIDLDDSRTREQRKADIDRQRAWLQRNREARARAEQLAPETGAALQALTATARGVFLGRPRPGGSSGQD
jgi:post-segregation antitoxin (ccd killing protein)